MKTAKYLLYLVKDGNKYNMHNIFNGFNSMSEGNEKEIKFDVEAK